MPQLAQRLGFDLADAFARDREGLADFYERAPNSTPLWDKVRGYDADEFAGSDYLGLLPELWEMAGGPLYIVLNLPALPLLRVPHSSRSLRRVGTDALNATVLWVARRASISPHFLDDPIDLAQAKRTRAVAEGFVSDLLKHFELGYGDTDS